MTLTPVWCSGFEFNTTAFLDTVTGTPTFNSAVPRTGSYCLEVSPANAALHARRDITAAAQVQARAAIRFSVLPGSGTAHVLHIVSTAANLSAQIRYNATGTKLEAVIQGGTAVGGPTIAANEWHVVEMQVNYTSAVTYTLDWWVDGVAQTQATRSVASATTGLAFRFGTIATNETYTAQIDDVICGTWTSAGETWGDGVVLPFVPFADGAHNTGAAGNFTDAAGTNITNVSTNVWTFLDELPPTSTDRVEQRLDTGGLLYVEVKLNTQPYDNRAPIAVEACGVIAGATALACSGAIKLRDDLGATDDAVFSGALSSATDLFKRKHYANRPAALGAWTADAFAQLRFRVGFSTDPNPDVYLGGVFIEAAFSGTLRPPYRNPMPPLIAQ